MFRFEEQTKCFEKYCAGQGINYERHTTTRIFDKGRIFQETRQLYVYVMTILYKVFHAFFA
jgi:hypothetical protein